MTVSASSIVLRATDVLADNASIRWTARELVRWHAPHAAEMIAEKMLLLMNALDHGQWSQAPNLSAATKEMHHLKSVSV